ncbi:hypothetical protein BGZ95_002229 [Linnemannia exigua]|uniref:F-box domain-containing protein n=1 Tax=Linnemannia exigua TaxID=604196 RepID=A0AAD4H3H9_9FUNG|nr:hypothetical protein BGZ95_002229 [Linnemannia exigua]
MDTIPDLCQRHIAQYLPSSSIHSLLYINEHWFQFAATLLYRNPFNTLKDTSLRNFLDGDDIRQRLHDLIHLLLICCGQQHLVTENTPYKTRRFTTPTINYLELYTHQTSRAIEYLSKVWHISSAENRTDRFDIIRMTLASYKPEQVSHLYIAMSCLKQMIWAAPQFTRLQRLEVYDDRGFRRNQALYDFFEELQKMQQQRPSSFPQRVLSELALVMPMGLVPVDDYDYLYAKPLVLTQWSQLRRLDLLSWQTMVDWESLPVANLNDLRFNLATLTKGFNPAAFFGSCNNLRTLFVHNVDSKTFSWIQQQPPDNSMAMLTTLEIGGASIPLMLSLTYLLAACSENLETLSIVLREDATTPYIPDNINWTIPLPKLHSLALKNRAVFEFHPAAMEGCPLLRHLTLGIDAESTDTGCKEVMSPRFEKWYALLETMKSVGRYGCRLESLRFEGTWIFGGRVALLATQPMERLKSLYLSPGVRSVNAEVVCSLVKGMEKLTLLEVAVEPADWHHNDELADLLEERSNLDVLPTNLALWPHPGDVVETRKK